QRPADATHGSAPRRPRIFGAPLMARARRLKRWWRRFARASPALRLSVAAAIALLLAFAVNGAYQLARKPTEIFFPVSGALYKTPAQTWRVYGPLFRRYATATISAPLLAALAQQEASGNPLVRTYWRWSWVG